MRMMAQLMSDDYQSNFHQIASTVCSHAKLRGFISFAYRATHARNGKRDVKLFFCFPSFSALIADDERKLISIFREKQIQFSEAVDAEWRQLFSACFQIIFKDSSQLPVASVKIYRPLKISRNSLREKLVAMRKSLVCLFISSETNYGIINSWFIC